MFPNVTVLTQDNTSITPTTQKHNVFYAGVFDRGPVLEKTTITNILDLKVTFGKYFELNKDEWMSIYNYFNYGNTSIDIIRVIGPNSLTASNLGGLKIHTEEDFDNLPKVENIICASSPGGWGNNLKIKITLNKNNIEFHTYLNNEYIETITETNTKVLNSGLTLKTDYFYAYIVDLKTLEYNLYGGITLEPNTEQISEAYEMADEEDSPYTFILANPNYVMGAVKLAESKKSIVFANFLSNSTKVVSPNLIYYEGYKTQTCPFTGKSIKVPVVGDVLGMRTYLANNEGINVSHCKRTYSLDNIIDFKVPKLKELYNSNINSLGKDKTYYYPYSEILSNGKNLTQQLIFNDLSKTCEQSARYFIFEYNDDYTRNAFKKQIQKVLNTYKDSRMISDFKITCDLSNQNSNEPNAMYLDVVYQQSGIIESTKIRLVAYN